MQGQAASLCAPCSQSGRSLVAWPVCPRPGAGKSRQPAILIGRGGDRDGSEPAICFTITSSNTIAYRPVKLGTTIAGKRVVREGLKDGDQVVVNGLIRVRPGNDGEPGICDRDGQRPLTGPATAFPPHPMSFSHFFIRRPIFAGVLSVLIFLVGLIAMFRLPVSRVSGGGSAANCRPCGVSRRKSGDHFPRQSRCPSSSAQRRRESAYMFSQATSDGVMTLTVTFKLGTDIDQAQVLVQNRVAQALPKPRRRSVGWGTHHQVDSRPDHGGAPDQ